MHLLIVSFIAGVLTVAAPCILPLLPIIVGGSAVQEKTKKSWLKPIIITGSLAFSVLIFTLLLKASTSLLGVPQNVWTILSGSIVLILGISYLAPKFWEIIMIKSGLYAQSNKLMSRSGKANPGLFKDILTGVALGPVFSSCSPTYALIVAVVLPNSFFEGLAYLISYVLGLAAILLLISIAGQSIISKLGWLSNPSGLFRRVIGILFLIVGIAVIFGLDRKFQAYVLEQGWYDAIVKIEQKF